MDSRRDFIQLATLAGAFLATGAANAQTTKTRYAEKLTDESGEYAAAPLPFALDALEPVIDPRTVEIHYNFHHKPAVTAANNAEAALAKARDNGDFSLVKFYEKELAFQLSSHLLDNLSGKGGDPTGDLAKGMSAEFGSYAKLKAQLSAATTAVEAPAGASWATTP